VGRRTGKFVKRVTESVNWRKSSAQKQKEETIKHTEEIKRRSPILVENGVL